LDVVKL